MKKLCTDQVKSFIHLTNCKKGGVDQFSFYRNGLLHLEDNNVRSLDDVPNELVLKANTVVIGGIYDALL